MVSQAGDLVPNQISLPLYYFSRSALSLQLAVKYLFCPFLGHSQSCIDIDVTWVCHGMRWGQGPPMSSSLALSLNFFLRSSLLFLVVFFVLFCCCCCCYCCFFLLRLYQSIIPPTQDNNCWREREDVSFKSIDCLLYQS